MDEVVHIVASGEKILFDQGLEVISVFCEKQYNVFFLFNHVITNDLKRRCLNFLKFRKKIFRQKLVYLLVRMSVDLEAQLGMSGVIYLIKGSLKKRLLTQIFNLSIFEVNLNVHYNKLFIFSTSSFLTPSKILLSHSSVFQA